MKNYAVIIGMDDYSNAKWLLHAAVSDALRFASWAIRFGDVAPENVKLLLSQSSPTPSVQVPDVLTPLSVLSATSETLQSVLYDDFKEAKWGADGDRLYFYYAGHGCSHPGVRGEKRAEPVLIFSDVVKLPRDFRKLFTFSDILEVLRGCGPKEQFFFLDACQDFLLDDDLESSGWGGRYMRPATLSSGAQAARQFAIYATSPGALAFEARGKGVFGSELIRGLRGDPASVRRVAGAGSYELRFSDLFRFVQKEVQRTVANLPTVGRNIQVPEQDREPSVPDPLILSFTAQDIKEVELTVRVTPGVARSSTRLIVFYEEYAQVPSYGPPLNAAHTISLKPAFYSIEAVAATYEAFRTDPFEVPSDGPLNLTLLPAVAGEAKPQLPFMEFRSDDQMMSIGVTGPENFRGAGTGFFRVDRPTPGIYRISVMTPDGVMDTQAFEYPYRSGFIELKPPGHQIGPEQLAALSKSQINPSPDGYLVPSEILGSMSNLAPASLLGFAAYATYTMDPSFGSRLRSFGLQKIAADRQREAWINIMLSVEANADATKDFLTTSSVIVYSDGYKPGRFTLLEGYAPAAQYLTQVPEGNVTVELRLPGMVPVRLPLTCFVGRVATLCVNVTSQGQVQAQIYLIPFSIPDMDPETVHLLEQAQRFYSGSEPLPELFTGRLLNLKQLDPLLGCIAGYTMVRSGRADSFRGTPVDDLAPLGWNPGSAMQNMLTHFGLLPDAHVLAGLCEPEVRERHFAAAAKLGVPIFTEGFQALIDFYRDSPGKLNGALQHSRRTLMTGSAFSAWFGYEPALVVEDGHFEMPRVPWTALEENRIRIERQLRAVGAVRSDDGSETAFHTAFLIAPDLILTAGHVVASALKPSEAGQMDLPSIRPDVKFSFLLSDSVDDQRGVLKIESLVAFDSVARLAVLRLEHVVTGVGPLTLAPANYAVKPDQGLYLIGFPFLQTGIEPELVAHVFGSKLGSKRVQPGYIIAAPPDAPSFDHDAFTLNGSAGSPVIDLESGIVIGLHWGAMNYFNGRRGRSVALWKDKNRQILSVAGVL